MDRENLDRIITTTYNYLRKVREALNTTSNVVNVAAAMAISAGDGDEKMEASQQAYERLAEGITHFVRAMRFFSQTGNTPEERVEFLGKARGTASFVIGEMEAAINHADTAGAWMLAKGAYEACEETKRAQTIAWEAEQAIRK
jgi:hypothetical protein